MKDKPQRIKYPDTGADNFQFVGYWAVNAFLREPVLMMFTDPEWEDINPYGYTPAQMDRFRKRWEKFAPGGKPVFYGGWLSGLARYDAATHYPRVSLEHSREEIRGIAYLEVQRMIPLEPEPALSNVLNRAGPAIGMPPFQVFDTKNNRVLLNLDEVWKSPRADS